ncbi:unnamed protein product, partial [Timema podura]|nr:unnamed protein product [Timema podura]
LLFPHDFKERSAESLRSGITSCPDDNPKKELDVFGSQLVEKFNQLMEADHNWRVAAHILGCSDREAISCDDANADLELDDFPTKDCQEDGVPTGTSIDVTRSSAAVLAGDADSSDDLPEVDIADKMKRECTLQ